MTEIPEHLLKRAQAAKAKAAGTSIACLNNNRQLLIAWHNFSGDNDQHIIYASAWYYPGFVYPTGLKYEPTADFSWCASQYLGANMPPKDWRSEEHTSELQSQAYIVCRRLLEKKKKEEEEE